MSALFDFFPALRGRVPWVPLGVLPTRVDDGAPVLARASLQGELWLKRDDLSSPVYGGNKDMAPWKMIGFPGAYADFYEYVDKHNIAYTAPPTSLAQDANGRIHIHIEHKRK